MSSIGASLNPIFFANSLDECNTNLDPSYPINKETSPVEIVLGVECFNS